MKIEDQIVSFGLAKKLKELGVNQDSLFAWKPSYSISDDQYINWSGEFVLKYSPQIFTTGQEVFKSWYPRYKELEEMKISAFSVAELGEILVKHGYNFFPYYCDQKEMECYIYQFSTYPNYVSAKTDVDCRAKMLIYLLENKLITL